MLTDKIRERRPDSVIILRADRGFNGKELIDLCEANGCYYIIGLAPIARLKKILEQWEPDFVDVLLRAPKVGGSLLRHYGEVDDYMAESWSKPRRVIVRDYWDDDRRDWEPRFIQTNIPRQHDGKCGKLWRMTAFDLYLNWAQRVRSHALGASFQAQFGICL